MIKRFYLAIAASVALGASVVALPAVAAPFAGVPATRSALVEAGAVAQARFQRRRSVKRGAYRSYRDYRSYRGYRGANYAHERAFSHPLYGRFPRSGRSVLFNSR